MLNRATLLGHLGQDVALRYTPTGIPVVTFSLATSAHYKDASDEVKEITDWHRIVVFKRQAENCAKFLAKGSRVYVEGRLSTRKWHDKEGVERYSTEITARRVIFLDRKPGDAQAAIPEEELAEPPVEDGHVEEGTW